MNLIEKLNKKDLISALWVVVMLNMLKADILSLYIPGTAVELAKTAGAIPITTVMFGAAIIMEFPILMIVLTQLLKHNANRWLNIISSTLTIIFVWAGFVAYPHYVFIAAVETICLLLIIWNSWKWNRIVA